MIKIKIFFLKNYVARENHNKQVVHYTPEWSMKVN